MANISESWRHGGTGRGAFILNSRAIAEIPLIARGFVGQTANIFEVENSAGTNLFTVDPSGNVSIAGSISAVVSETVTGDITLTGNLVVNGNTTLGNAVGDTLSVVATSTFSNPVTLSSTLAVTGITTAQSLITAPRLGLVRRGATPAPIGVQGQLYTRAGDADTTELFYLDPAGNDVQITDAGAIDGASVHWDDDEQATFGNVPAAPDSAIEFDTAQTNDSWMFGVDVTSRTLHICDIGDMSFDFARAVDTTPTLVIHSATAGTTQWLSLTHNATDGVLTTGAGAISLVPSGVGANSLLLTNSAGARTVAHTVVTFNGTAGAAAGGTLMDINVTQTGAGASPLFDIDVTDVYTGEIFSAIIGAVAYTSDVFNIDLGNTQTAAQIAVLDAGDSARTTDAIQITDNTTSTGDVFGISVAGAAGSGAVFDIDIGAVLWAGDILNLDLGATSTTGQIAVFAGGAAARTTHLIELNDAGTSTGIGLDINKTGASYSAGLGYIDLVRSGNFTGVDAETAIDFRIAPVFTLTEPGAGNFNYYGLQIDMSGVLVTGGVGAARIACITLTGNVDADLGTSRAILITGTGAGNAIELGDSPLIYSSGAEVIRFDDSTAARGIAFTLTAAAAQDIAATAGNLQITGVAGAEVVFNEGSADVDFRVESNNLTSALQIDGGFDTIGIGATAVDNQFVTITERAETSGAPAALVVTGAAHTGITAATLCRGIIFNQSATKTWAAGAGPLATQYEVGILAPTYDGNAAGALTITDSATFYIDRAPQDAGANIVLTNTYALWVDAGFARFDDDIYIGGQPASEVHHLDITAGGEVTFNEGGIDLDFRVESDALDNIIQVNAGNNTVGIGNAGGADGNLLVITDYAQASGTPKGFTFIGAAHTSITAATECIGVDWDVDATKTWAAGAGPLATQREVVFRAPTYAGNAGGALTIVGSATVAISGAPIEGTNITLASVYGLLIQAGAVGSATNSYGMYINTQTGATNNYAAQFAGGNVGILQAVSSSIVLSVGWNASTMATGTTAARHFQTSGNITELAGAAITDIVGAYFNTFTITDGGGAETVDTVATVYIAGAPTIGSTPTNGPYSLFVDAGTSRFDAELLLNHTGVIAGTPINIDYARTAYTTAVGLVDVVRSGALTGVDTQSIIDLQIAPAFTLTEPGAGSVNFYGVNIDLSAIAVTAGVGTSVLAALRLVANADADVGTNYALFVDAGVSRLDGVLQQNDAIYFTQTDGAEQIDSQADGYVDYTVGTGHRFRMSAADTDVRLEFVGTTNSGLFQWMEDEDYFRFNDVIATAADIDVNLSAGSRIYGGGIQANKQDLAAATNLTLDENDGVVNVTTGGGAANIITLPAASGNEGMIVSVYLVVDGAQNANVVRAGADVIQNGSASLANTQVALDDAGDFVMLQCVNSTMWQILVNSGGTVT